MKQQVISWQRKKKKLLRPVNPRLMHNCVQFDQQLYCASEYVDYYEYAALSCSYLCICIYTYVCYCDSLEIDLSRCLLYYIKCNAEQTICMYICCTYISMYILRIQLRTLQLIAVLNNLNLIRFCNGCRESENLFCSLFTANVLLHWRASLSAGQTTSVNDQAIRIAVGRLMHHSAVSIQLLQNVLNADFVCICIHPAQNI